jgi:hypothetical protein
MTTLLELVKPISEGGDVKCAAPAQISGLATQPTGQAVQSIVSSVASNGAVKFHPDIRAGIGSESLGDQIRFHVNALAEIEAGITSRRNRILFELRKKKLVPQARRR